MPAVIGVFGLVGAPGCGDDCKNNYHKGDRCPFLIRDDGKLEILPMDVVLRPPTGADGSDVAETGGMDVEEGLSQELIVKGTLRNEIPADGYTVEIRAEMTVDAGVEESTSGSSGGRCTETTSDLGLDSNAAEHVALTTIPGGGCSVLSDILLRCVLDASGIARFAVVPVAPTDPKECASVIPESGDGVDSTPANVRVSYGVDKVQIIVGIEGQECDPDATNGNCVLPPVTPGEYFCAGQSFTCEQFSQRIPVSFELGSTGASKPYDIGAELTLTSSNAWFLERGGEVPCGASNTVRPPTYPDVLPRNATISNGADVCVIGADGKDTFTVKASVSGATESKVEVKTSPQLAAVDVFRLPICPNGMDAGDTGGTDTGGTDTGGTDMGVTTCYEMEIVSCWGTLNDLVLPEGSVDDLVTVVNDGQEVPFKRFDELQGIPCPAGYWCPKSASEVMNNRGKYIIVLQNEEPGVEYHDFDVITSQQTCSYTR